MKNIFRIYWIWHIVILVIYASGVILPIWVSMCLNILLYMNLGFIAIVPSYKLFFREMYHRNDNYWWKASQVAIVIRISISCLAIIPDLINYWHMSALNIFLMGAYFYIVSDSYFKK